MSKGVDTGGHPRRQVSREGFSIDVSPRGQGYGGDIDHVEGYSAGLGGRPERVTTSYAVGPFRTPYRARVGVESLANRIEAGRPSIENYSRGTSYESEAEYRARPYT